MAVTLSDIQADISADFDFKSTPLDSSSTEYARRTVLINRFLKQWGKRRLYAWQALLTEVSGVSITAGTTSVSLPSDFKTAAVKPNGAIKIGTVDYILISRTSKESYNSDTRIAWITGNDAIGYTLNVSPSPTSDVTVTLPYYTGNLATDSGGTGQEALSAADDIVKCPDPLYITYYVLDVLNRTDNQDGNTGIDYRQMAEDIMDEMNAAENILAINADQTVSVTSREAGFPNLGE